MNGALPSNWFTFYNRKERENLDRRPHLLISLEKITQAQGHMTYMGQHNFNKLLHKGMALLHQSCQHPLACLPDHYCLAFLIHATLQTQCPEIYNASIKKNQCD